ncbi:hypothetical protein MM236_19175 [Belliella sp. DSM 107340]|uniref:Uncharacterized protein n=1 Tax=Belliella calami TaxID=2923436 RepID=A0ABS9UU22_9BACT|nr:hypothetical protein [Belliella calami]MCH7400126.1 hypothetical protein [Belliella calami]
MNHQTELNAAYNILERGVRAKVRAPFFLRLFGKKTVSISIKKLYAGTLLESSACYLKTGIKEEQLKEVETEAALELMAKHGKEMTKAIAIAALNSKWKIRLFSGLLGRYLLWNMHWREIFALLEFILVYNGTSDFMHTTRLLRAMLITAPSNQGQKAKKKGS